MKNFWPQTAIEWVELIGKSLFVVGILGAVYQYFDVKRENRVKETMAQLQIFNRDPLLAIRLKLGNVWDSYQPQLLQLKQRAVMSEQDKALIQAKIVIPVIQQNQLRHDLDALVDFFDNLSICVQSGICDQDVAQAFFGSYAQSFYELHRPWIVQQRETISHYACHLEIFVKLQSQECEL